MKLHPPVESLPAGAPGPIASPLACGSWRLRVRRWMQPRPPREPACLIDAAQLETPVPTREPLAALDDPARSYPAGLVLLLDHSRIEAMEALRTAQAAHGTRFAEGAVVVGLENLPADDALALAPYRAVTSAPVFGVDLQRAGDRALLAEALVAGRVIAGLRRRWGVPA